ncbi:MAG: long-chain fatty acid--CoA ligase [Nitriliruptoraceae bacterium]
MTSTKLIGAPLRGPVEPHLLAALWRWADQEPDRELLASREGETFVSHTAAAVRDRIKGIAAGLIAHGIAPGDRVALLSRTSIGWVEADHAILAAGAVTVPIYDSSSGSQIERIVADSGAALVFVETPAQRELVQASTGGRADAPPVLAIAEGALDDLVTAGADHLDTVEQRIRQLDGDHLAALIYSSGTTGQTKGCELTHANLCHNTRQTVEQAPQLFTPGARTLVFLPLAHALGRIQVHAALDQGVLTGFASGIPELREELLLFRPTFIVAVPRIFEKVYDGARGRALDAGRAAVFDRAMSVAVRWSQAKTSGRRPLGLRLQHLLFDRLVYGRIRQAFGGQLGLAICGGAALSGDLARRFDGMGIAIAQGYGLTEAAPIVSGGPSEQPDHDSVGQVYPGTTVRIAEDGELLVQGPQVFRGYWNAPEATAATLVDGWLHTGDLGTATERGDLVITGRKKEIIVTAGGKNILPGPLEDRVRAHPLVDQCVVIGEGRPFIAALVFLNDEEVQRWRARQTSSETAGDRLQRGGRPRDGAAASASGEVDAPRSVEVDAAGSGEVEVETHPTSEVDTPPTGEHWQPSAVTTSGLEAEVEPDLRAEIDLAIAVANEAVSRGEAIRTYRIVRDALRIETGDLTPTQKLRRASIAERFEPVITSIYG